MSKDNLLIVWSNADKDVAVKFPLLYSSVILERNYWGKAHLMLWGPSIKLAAWNKEIQEKLLQIQQTGVKMSACIVCVEEYEVIEELKALDINIKHTGKLLTKALKSKKWSVMTI